MNERAEILSEIATLEVERKSLHEDEKELHSRYMATPRHTRHAHSLGRELDRIDARLDEISDALGELQHRLWPIEAALGRHERLADIAYGQWATS